MVDVLNAETAKAYAVSAISTQIVITSVEATKDADEPTFDVGFTYRHEGRWYDGCMTVWLERDGRLYGEW